MNSLMPVCTASVSRHRIRLQFLILGFQKVGSEQGKVKVSVSSPREGDHGHNSGGSSSSLGWADSLNTVSAYGGSVYSPLSFSGLGPEYFLQCFHYC